MIRSAPLLFAAGLVTAWGPVDGRGSALPVAGEAPGSRVPVERRVEDGERAPLPARCRAPVPAPGLHPWPAPGIAPTGLPSNGPGFDPAVEDAVGGALPARPADPEFPDYYAFELVPTKNVPGSGRTEGTGHLLFTDSPYGMAVTEDGHYRNTVRVDLEHLPPTRSGVFTVWFTTPQVDRIQRAGVLDADGRLDAEVAFNKFLAVITLEPSDDPEATTWQGPIVARGMSPSGKMHTMAGHGPFQQENCAAYGY